MEKCETHDTRSSQTGFVYDATPKLIDDKNLKVNNRNYSFGISTLHA